MLDGSSHTAHGCRGWNSCLPLTLQHAYVITRDVIVFFQNLSMFRAIVKDVFAGLPDASRLTAQSALIRSTDVQSALEVVAKERGIVAHKPWLDKCLHLFNVSQVNSGQSPIFIISCSSRDIMLIVLFRFRRHRARKCRLRQVINRRVAC